MPSIYIFCSHPGKFYRFVTPGCTAFCFSAVVRYLVWTFYSRYSWTLFFCNAIFVTLRCIYLQVLHCQPWFIGTNGLILQTSMQNSLCCWFHQIFSFFVVSLNLCMKVYMWVLHHAVLCHFVPRDTYLVNMLLQDLDISQGSVLYDVDEATVRSLNGCRVADQIIRLVPNIEVDLRNQIRMFRFLNCHLYNIWMF